MHLAMPSEEDNRKKMWESLKDLNKQLFEQTGDRTYETRYEACKRLLGEEETPKKEPEHFK